MKMVMHSLLLFWIGLAPALVPVLAAETGLTVRQEGVLLNVEGWLRVPVNPAVAWSVLTDYGRFPEFVPGIHANQVVASTNGVKTIEQRGEVISGPVRLAYTGQMRVEERAGEGIDIVFLSGPFKDVRGEWNIEPGHPLKLIYRMQLDLMKSPFPPPLAPAIAEQQVRTWVDVFGREMERRMERRKAK